MSVQSDSNREPSSIVSERIVSARVMRRIEKTASILDDAASDGLHGFDPNRLDDLVVRDLTEFLILSKYRMNRVKQTQTFTDSVLVHLGEGVKPPSILQANEGR